MKRIHGRVWHSWCTSEDTKMLLSHPSFPQNSFQKTPELLQISTFRGDVPSLEGFKSRKDSNPTGIVGGVPAQINFKGRTKRFLRLDSAKGSKTAKSKKVFWEQTLRECQWKVSWCRKIPEWTWLNPELLSELRLTCPQSHNVSRKKIISTQKIKNKINWSKSKWEKVPQIHLEGGKARENDVALVMMVWELQDFLALP